jgi:hypothetical protein
VLTGKVVWRSTEVSSHRSCTLGEWYYHNGKELYGQLAEFKSRSANGAERKIAYVK